jgi:hypothetical protein
VRATSAASGDEVLAGLLDKLNGIQNRLSSETETIEALLDGVGRGGSAASE